MGYSIHSVDMLERYRLASMVAKADGSAITSGTVNYYLKCIAGTHSGQWWSDAEQTWVAAETGAAMTHVADGLWMIYLSDYALADDSCFIEYAQEANDLHIPGEGRLLRADAQLAVESIGNNAGYLSGVMGVVGNVCGDVEGRILGGGIGAISGVGVRADARQVLGTTLTETTAGRLAAALVKLLDVAAPANSLNDLATAAGLSTVQTALSNADNYTGAFSATVLANAPTGSGTGASAAEVWAYAGGRTITGGTLSDSVTLAATQPSYAPAKAGDAMTLTADYDAAKTAAQAAEIPAATDIADAVLARDVSYAEAAAPRTSLATAVLAATNKANTSANSGYLTVYRTDGVTEHARILVSTNSEAEPIDGVG